jgi:HAE1 family hydrophobic/amphiphilic exporter-1
VSDVGQAVPQEVDRTVAAYQNNKPGIILAVFKQPGANVIETVDQIKAQLPQLTARIPPAIKVETILDRTTTIRASVADVEFTLALTIGLVVLVILLFLRNFWPRRSRASPCRSPFSARARRCTCSTSVSTICR